MKALQYERFGGPEVLELAEVPDPVPGAGDVVIEVAMTALNHLDIVQRNGWYTLPRFAFPHVAGMDVAGRVIEVGAQVDVGMLGRRVVVDPSLAGVGVGSKLAGMGDIYGDLGVIGANVAGGYAERCLVPASHLFEIPDAMSWTQAVAFPCVWLTAHHALFERGRLAPGETILIHAAGSGVSTAAIQLARNAGATVLATAGNEVKCAKAIELGAAHAANNRSDDIAAWVRQVTDGRGVDMVLDHVGPALWNASISSLKPRGRLVNCGNTSGNSVTIDSLEKLFHLGISVIGSDPYRPSEFPDAWRQYIDGSFQTPIDSVFPLAHVAVAQQKLSDGDVFGKIVVDVAPEL